LTAEVKAVVEENKGLIDLLVYDVGKYSGVDKDGRITIDEQQLNEDPKAQESVVLARALGVNFSPYVIIVDDQGYIIYRHSGYVDSGLLERQVQRVTE
jgi:thioredoxin-related protein